MPSTQPKFDRHEQQITDAIDWLARVNESWDDEQAKRPGALNRTESDLHHMCLRIAELAIQGRDIDDDIRLLLDIHTRAVAQARLEGQADPRA